MSPTTNLNREVKKELEVGYQYQTSKKIRCKGEFGWPDIKESKCDGTFHIIHKNEKRDLPFLAYWQEQNSFVYFDKEGRDKWMECGGNWIVLDLETKKKAKFQLLNTEELP